MDVCYGHHPPVWRSAHPTRLGRGVASTTDPTWIGTVSVMARHCSRTGCAAHAESTLTYQYGRALVWIDDLSEERDPHSYDLCPRHAARLSVPNGWRLEDRRSSLRLGTVVAGGREHRLAG